MYEKLDLRGLTMPRHTFIENRSDLAGFQIKAIEYSTNSSCL